MEPVPVQVIDIVETPISEPIASTPFVHRTTPRRPVTPIQREETIVVPEETGSEPDLDETGDIPDEASEEYIYCAPNLPAPKQVIGPHQDCGCIAGPSGLFAAGYTQGPVVDTEITGDDLTDVTEYGFGFWMQFLTRYPVRLMNGKNEPWYFVARLTSNNPYGDKGLGDRLLGIWQGDQYSFFTVDQTTNNNLHLNVPYGDIEGVWSYVYYSYNNVAQKAVAFMQFQGQEFQRLQFDAVHPVPTYMRFIMGGTDLDEYPGFNGQFSRPVLRIGWGAFIGDLATLQTGQLDCNPVPEPQCITSDVLEITTATDVVNFEVDERDPVDVLAHIPLPDQYSVSGWFRFSQPENAARQHLVFRTTINSADVNENNQQLGDRQLMALVGTTTLQFSTYSYGDLIGNGSPDIHKSIVHNQAICEWHFIYFGYSRQERKAIAFVLFNQIRQEAVFQNINHFFSSEHIMYLAKDQFYPSYNGQVRQVRYQFCLDAYTPEIAPICPPLITIPGPDGVIQERPEILPVQRVIQYYDTQPEVEAEDEVVVDIVITLPTVEELFTPMTHDVEPTPFVTGGTLPLPVEECETEFLPENDAFPGIQPVAPMYIPTPSLVFDLDPVVISDVPAPAAPPRYDTPVILRPKTIPVPVIDPTPSVDPFSELHRPRTPAHSVPDVTEVDALVLDVPENQYLTEDPYLTDPYDEPTICEEEEDFEVTPTAQSETPTLPDPLTYFPTPVPVQVNITAPVNVTPQTEVPVVIIPTDESETPVDRAVDPLDSFENECIAGPDIILDSAIDGEAVGDVQLSGEELSDTSEYGYGFWTRFLTRYPTPLYNGLVEPWYFVSRMTDNYEYGDDGMGDRVLAIFQGQGVWSFSTYSVLNNTFENVHQTLNYGDIEGLWTYMYFSYSTQMQRAVAHVSYPNGDKQRAQFDVEHISIEYLHFTLGGTDQSNYPGFNGQFSRPVIRMGEGSFMNDFASLVGFSMSCNPEPALDCLMAHELEVVGDERMTSTYVAGAQPEQIAMLTEDTRFPLDYSVHGWFKWQPLQPQQLWHVLFRVSLNSQGANRNSRLLGDRVLSGFLGQQGVLQFSTYSYADLQGLGNPNLFQSVPHNNQINLWHHVYFGYSRQQRKAVVMVKFGDNTNTLNFDNVNHYLSDQLYLFLGKDLFFPSYNGQISNFGATFCSDSLTFIPEPIDTSDPVPSPSIASIPAVYIPTDVERQEVLNQVRDEIRIELREQIVEEIRQEVREQVIEEIRQEVREQVTQEETQQITHQQLQSQGQICLSDDAYFQITPENIDQMIVLLTQQRQRINQGRSPVDQNTCICSLATQNNSTQSMIQMESQTSQNMNIIGQLLKQKGIRVKMD